MKADSAEEEGMGVTLYHRHSSSSFLWYFHASAFYFMLCFLSSIFFLFCHVILVFCWFSFPPSTLLLIHKLFKGKKREENSWWEDITWDDDLLLFHVSPQRRSLTGTVWDNFHLLFLSQILIWCWSLLYINNQMSNQDPTTQRLINSTDNCKENWFQKPFRSGHDFDKSFCSSAEKGTLSHKNTEICLGLKKRYQMHSTKSKSQDQRRKEIQDKSRKERKNRLHHLFAIFFVCLRICVSSITKRKESDAIYSRRGSYERKGNCFQNHVKRGTRDRG